MGLDYGSDYCVDAGSAQCPCFLAETGGCLSCSLLRGEAFCDCRWTGECIYQRYLLRPLLWAREDRRRVARVSGYEKINERAFLLEIALPQEVAESLKTPGSYLFLRPTALPDDFFAPFSILEVGSEGYVRLAIEILGPKTRLLKYPGREVAVKGPYRNGLMGLRAVKSLVGGRALIIAKGIAQAPALHLATYLSKRGNQITALIWPGTLGEIFVASRLLQQGAVLRVMEKKADHGLSEIAAEIGTGTYDLVASSGTDQQHQAVAGILARSGCEAALVTTNNAVMTCGEGICGSCQVTTAAGQQVKACKHQLDARELWGAGERTWRADVFQLPEVR